MTSGDGSGRPDEARRRPSGRGRVSRPRLVLVTTLVALTACSDPLAPLNRTTADPAPTTVPSTTPASTTTSHPVSTSTPPTSTPGPLATSGACWTAVPTGSGPVTLVDTTEALGLDDLLVGLMGHAVAIGDANGDGWPDLFVGGFADRPANDYRQRGASGAAPDRILFGGPNGFSEGRILGWGRTSGAVFVDLDGNGDEDLVVARNHRPDNRNDEVDLDPTMAFRNDGTWTPVPLPISGLGARAVVPVPREDGPPDLFVTEDHWSGGRSVYLRNLGGFEFEDATAAMGLPDDLHGYGAVAVDLDGDGYVDLFVAGSNRLFAGGPDGFSEVDGEVFAWEGPSLEDDVTGVTVADVDRDGRPDLVLGHHFNSVLEGGPTQPIRVFLNRTEPGRWVFEELPGLDPLPTKSPHVEVVDVDQDGWPDLVTTAASVEGPPVWFRSRGAEGGPLRFERVGEPGPAQYWVTGVSGDFDRDGQLEVLFLEWDPSLPSMVWSASGGVGGWVSVEAPIGSSVTAAEDDGGRWSGIAGGSSGYAAGASTTVRFGIGDAAAVELIVTSPDGRSTAFTAAANGAHSSEGCR